MGSGASIHPLWLIDERDLVSILQRQTTLGQGWSSEALEMAKLVASTITVKDLISSEADDEHDEQQEKSTKGDIDPYVSMKLRGMCLRREIYRLCAMTICGKYLNAL